MAIKRFLNLTFVVAVAVTISACNAPPAGKIVKLRSGKAIRVLAVGPLMFTNGNTPAIMLTYETGLKVSDLPAVQTEAIEIWKDFRQDIVNPDQYSAGVVSAQPRAGALGFGVATGSYAMVNGVLQRGRED